MTDIIVKDTLRASVEAASKGTRTVIYTSKGQPSFMNIIPKFDVSTVDASYGSGTHPAFIVNGKEVSQILVGTYQGYVSNGELVSQPFKDPSTGYTYDQFVAYAKAAGSGHHVVTNAEWAAIALICQKNSNYMPLGNNNNGSDISDSTQAGFLASTNTIYDGTNLSKRILSGSGTTAYRHNNTKDGICDLNGNVWEFSTGVRVVGNEVQIMTNNNGAMAATDHSATSAAWFAVDATNGALVTPTFTGTVAAGTYVATTPNTVRYGAVGSTAAYTLGSSASPYRFDQFTNAGTTPVSASALLVLQKYCLFTNNVLDHALDGFYTPLTTAGTEYVMRRGGDWSTGYQCGVFAGYLRGGRGAYGAIGSRVCYIDPTLYS